MIDPSDLTEEIFDELEDYLVSDATPENTLLLSDLDGFLAGIVVGPELIMPSEWVPLIWGDGEPEFEDEEQAERIMGIIMARYNQIIQQLDDEPGSFKLLLYKTPDGGLIVSEWVTGFMDAFSLRSKSWDPLLDDKSAWHLMSPIMALVDEEDDKPIDERSVTEETLRIQEESVEILPFVIKEIYDYWKVRRGIANDNTWTIGKKVGRNEPCPCGSGKKYKRCCGAN